MTSKKFGAGLNKKAAPIALLTETHKLELVS